MKIETITSNVQTVPLSQLRLAKENVRKVKPKALDQLADDIAAHGVLQSCIVYIADGLFHVVGGGRRYRALKALEKAKRIDGDYAVPLQVRERSQAVELSLAENIQREEMNPADCIRAFGKLETEGHAPEDIAVRFGASKTYVKQMLKLASLDKKLIAAMAREELSVETAQVLTRASSKAEQVRLFEAHGDNAGAIRFALAEGKIESDHRFYRFVGRETYEAAGGTISSDLFGDTAFIDHPELLLELTVKAMEAAAEKQREEGWLNVTYDLENAYHSYAYDTARPDAEHEPGKKVAEKIAALEKEIAEEEARAEEEDDYSDTYKAEQAIAELKASLRYFSDELKAEADLALIIDHKGQLNTRASVKPKPIKQEQQAKADKPPFSASLIDQMEAMQTMTVQRQVAGDPDLAMQLMLTAMVANFHDDWSQRPLGLSMHRPSLADPSDIAGSSSFELDEALAVINEVDATAIGEHIAAMNSPERMALLAALTAVYLTKVSLGDGRSAIAPLGQHWKPETGFFEKLRKDTMLTILREEVSVEAADNCSKLKKADLAEEVNRRVAECEWLPEGVAR